MKVGIASRMACLAAAVFSSVVTAATLTYQPSPYRGTDVTVSPDTPNTASNASELRIGEDSNLYCSALKLDLEGLPASPSFVGLYVWAYSAGSGYTPTGSTLYALVNNWDETSTWNNTAWSGYNLGNIGAPTTGAFNGIGMTSLYGQWKSGSITNGGLFFVPTGTVNQVHGLHSSDVTSKAYRPYLYLQYTETVTPPSLKLPLPGRRSWVVTTEIGGWDAKYPGQQLGSHIGSNYFAIDFGPSSNPSYSGDIPIRAVASGIVAKVDTSSANGNYVVINHSGVNSETTGYTTRYLHLKYSSGLTQGSSIAQGDLIGYMGDTGDAQGVHLHFGVRYDGGGSSSNGPLTYVKMEGIHLKQYQTDVDSWGNRTADSCFPSTNTP